VKHSEVVTHELAAVVAVFQFLEIALTLHGDSELSVCTEFAMLQ